MENVTQNKTAYLAACVCYGFQDTHVHRLNVLGSTRKSKNEIGNKFFPVPIPFTSDVNKIKLELQYLNKNANRRKKSFAFLTPFLLTPCHAILDPETITLSCLKYNMFFVTGGYLSKYKNTQHLVTTSLHPTKRNILSCVIMSHSIDVTQVASRMLEFNK